MEGIEAEVFAGGSTFRCRARLNHWKEHVQAASFMGRDSRPGLPDWNGTIYIEGDTDSAIEAAAWAISDAEDARLCIDDFQGPFGVVGGDLGKGVLEISGHGALKPAHGTT
jgi:hypothetical protein